MRVVVRLRPSNNSLCTCDPHVGTTISTPMNPQGYEFPAVLGVESTQREAYIACGIPMIDALLDGQQACLFAYGQTGSGKTFSLLGAEGGKNPHKLNGIVPQIVGELFRRFSTLENQGVKHTVSASFVEVSDERIRDLCDEPDKNGNQPYLGVRETRDGPVFISSGTRPVGEAQIPVHSSRGLIQIIEQCMAKRVTGVNDYHEHSSRSHALLTLKLEKRVGTTCQLNSLLLVDLAGSECYNSVRPHAKINVSLLALGRVLKALAANKPHRPYRDSVLTRLLQACRARCGRVVLARGVASVIGMRLVWACVSTALRWYTAHGQEVGHETCSACCATHF